MNVFFGLNPTKLIRWQAYFNEWERHHLDDVSRTEWIAGGYTQRAVAACFSKSAKYPSDPIKLYQEPVETDEEEEKHVFTDADRFFVFAQAMNKHIREPEDVKPNDDIDNQEHH